jgi:hypothetical protein
MMNLSGPTVVELERELAVAHDEIARLKQQLAQAPTGMVVERHRSGFVAPSETELQSLYRIGTRLAPKLGIDQTPEHFAGFAAAFSYVATLSRTDKLATDRMASWWCEAAREHARARRDWSDIKPSHLTLAVLAHGDVPHTFDPARFPYDLAFGLSIGTSRLPTGAGWLGVLEREAFRAATPLPAVSEASGPRHIRPRDIPADYVGRLDW